MKTNYEFYKKTIKDNMLSASVCDIYSVTLGEKCDGYCKNCFDKLFKWLNEEYKEPIKLTQTEYHILKGLEEKYKYIVRNDDVKLFVVSKKPYRDEFGYWNITSTSCVETLIAFSHLFKFIKWEDEEPYSVEELLKCEVLNNE